MFWDILHEMSPTQILDFVEEAVNLIEINLSTLPPPTQLDDLPILQRSWMIYLFHISKPFWKNDGYEFVNNEKKVAIFVMVIDYLLADVIFNDGWSEYDLKVIKHLLEISDNTNLCLGVKKALGNKLDSVSTTHTCKACGDEIKFEGLWASACGNGHVWSNQSVV